MRESKRGNRPGGHYIDKRAGRLLAEHVSEGPDDQMLTTEEVVARRQRPIPRIAAGPRHRPAVLAAISPHDQIQARQHSAMAEAARARQHQGVRQVSAREERMLRFVAGAVVLAGIFAAIAMSI
jgi:hypothetical protein